MKNILYIFIILALTSCHNDKKPIIKFGKNPKTTSETYPIINKKTDNLKIDTISKKSEPFLINGIKCYWELKLIIKEGENADTEGKLELKNYLTNKSILTNSDYYSLDDSYYTNSFNSINFESLNESAIKDLNFDGYKDFMIYGKSESGSAGDFYKVYLFNNNKKIFKQSKELSAYEITIDSISKTVSSYGKNGAGYNVTGTNHFGKNGKIRYSEVTERKTINTTNGSVLFKITYSKVIDGKVVKTKIDTVSNY